MSYGFYRMGSSVPGKKLPKLDFLNDVFEQVVAPAHTKPIPPAIADTLLEGEVHEAGNLIPGGNGTWVKSDTSTPMPKGDRSMAKAQGYTGDECSNCHGMRMKMAGHCMVCEDCGTTTGCS